MSDTRLREQERRWRETGSLQDEAAYLLERIRSGDLDRDRLELAAYCCHPAAMIALEASRPPPDLFEWAVGLNRWPMAGERAALEACRVAVSESVKHEGPSQFSDEFFETSLAAIEATACWLECPCDRHAQEARDAAAAVPAHWTPLASMNARLSAHYLWPEREDLRAVADPQYGRCVSYAAIAVGGEVVRSHMEKALLSWIGLGPNGVESA
jgi:hypothetical protein